MEFRVLSRGAGRYLLVLAGWAFDHRIFLEKNWDYDLVVCDDPDPSAFAAAAAGFLEREKPFPLSLLGWSMGGQLVNSLFSVPGFSDRIEQAFVMSAPRDFDPAAVAKVRRELLAEGPSSLKKFYDLVFRGNAAFRERFAREYEAGLVSSLDVDSLAGQLDFLGSVRIGDAFFLHPKVRLFYSLRDPIVSAAEILRLRPGIMTVPATHIPFWYDEVVHAVNER